MKYQMLDYDTAHEVVERNRFLELDGWDIVTWRRDEAGEQDPRGQFRNGKWGIRFVYPLREDGQWRVPVNYVTNR